jgi:hypothetical protein
MSVGTIFEKFENDKKEPFLIMRFSISVSIQRQLKNLSVVAGRERN